MQLSIDLGDNKFGEIDYSKDEAKILLIFFASKDLTGADYFTSSTNKTFNCL